MTTRLNQCRLVYVKDVDGKVDHVNLVNHETGQVIGTWYPGFERATKELKQ